MSVEASTIERQAAMPFAVFLDHEGAFVPGLESRSKVRLGRAELTWLADQAGHGGLRPTDSVPDPTTLAELESLLLARTPEGPFAGPPEAPEAQVPALHDDGSEHRMATPAALGLTDQGFDFLDHRGDLRVRLDGRGVVALEGFTQPATFAAAYDRQRSTLGPAALDEAEFADLVGRLTSTGVVVNLATDAAHAQEGRATREFRRSIAIQRERTEQVKLNLARHHEAEASREEETGQRRIKVVPVNSEGNPLLSLGLLMTHAQAFDGGRLNEHYQFLPDWADQTVPALTSDDPPAVYLFSNYIWSHAWNVVRSAEVKERNPASLTVHGGPNTPKYEADIQAFFAMNPQVDVTVHGEGEATLTHLLDVIRPSLADGHVDRSVLAGVPGISYRDGSEVVHTEKRDRIADLDTIPSPYESGLFDSVGDTEITLMTVETNRGCPYGCTYCDWGSATLSRIRKFDLERVFHELEWCARHKVNIIFNADANFGIFARDVEIARKLVELKLQYGYPRVFESSYAKNTVKHLREIIEILASGGVLSTGTLSLQSVDPATLDAIHRSNIRWRSTTTSPSSSASSDLPLVIELMMGLPGSTMRSFLGDLQQCIDKEVKARVNPTEVLMNSPMNDPEYRAEHEIATLRPVNQDWSENNRTRKKSLVVSTSSFSRSEYDDMERYRQAFLLFENFGVLRQLSRHVRQVVGVTEMDFYVELVDTARREPLRWPAIAFVMDVIVDYMIPPVSWALFMGEIRDYVISLGVPDDSALDAVLRAQLALIPARDRAFPEVVELEHDVATWQRDMLVAKRSGEADWASAFPRLGSYGPATLEIDDPQALTATGLGMPLVYDPDSDWELASPVARPMRFRNTVNA